jgi:hypothetical protein
MHDTYAVFNIQFGDNTQTQHGHGKRLHQRHYKYLGFLSDKMLNHSNLQLGSPAKQQLE